MLPLNMKKILSLAILISFISGCAEKDNPRFHVQYPVVGQYKIPEPPTQTNVQCNYGGTGGEQ